MDFVYIGTVSVSEEGSTIPLNMKLHPVYPNPFNPVATIQFDIAENYQSNTMLNVYDISKSQSVCPIHPCVSKTKFRHFQCMKHNRQNGK